VEVITADEYLHRTGEKPAGRFDVLTSLLQPTQGDVFYRINCNSSEERQEIQDFVMRWSVRKQLFMGMQPAGQYLYIQISRQ
jgi:hypothetical protein